MTKFDNSKIYDLTNESIADIKFDNVVCYAFVEGVMGETEGDVYIFDVVNEELRLHKGNIHRWDLSIHNVCKLIPKAIGFYKGGSMHACDERWTCVQFMMGCYVFMPREMERDIEWALSRCQERNPISRLAYGVHYLCDRVIRRYGEPIDKVDIDENVLNNCMFRVLELVAESEKNGYKVDECRSMTKKIVERELERNVY